ncbi:MAG: LptA/OstA family protein [Vicinamibacterales bacterium]|nr:LptA/OstA family protein [Vicinamibacterales bacterium]
MRCSLRRLLVPLAFVLWAAPALAQLPGFSVGRQYHIERFGTDHWRLTGQVELEREGQKFFADVVDYYVGDDRLEASGNVVYVSEESRIAADKMVFDTRRRTGSF